MKKLRHLVAASSRNRGTLIIFALLALPLLVSAQNLLIQFYPPASTAGPPGNPQSIQAVGADTSLPAGWDTNMPVSDYLLNKPMWDANVTQWRFSRDLSNFTALRNLLADFRDYENFVAVSNPTAAQVSIEVRKLNGAFIRLAPLLQDLYRNQ